MIHLLWRNPRTLARATEDVRRVAGDAANLTLEQVGRLDCVEACVHETLRLKPVASTIPLQTLRETTIGGVHVPAGIVFVSMMRRDSVSKSHVPRAAAFEPERWMVEGGPSQLAGSAKRVSMPFGAGPRICPGRYLALLEMKMAMALLLGRFDIESVDTHDGREAREHLSFTMTPVGLRMRMRLREHAVVAAQRAPAAR